MLVAALVVTVVPLPAVAAPSGNDEIGDATEIATDDVADEATDDAIDEATDEATDDSPTGRVVVGGATSVTSSVRGARLALQPPPPVPTRPVPPPSGPVVHLTFDDGPAAATPAMLDLLRRHGARATFFVLGSQVDGGAGVMRRIVAEGHRVGNHTWSHPSLAGISASSFASQIGRTQDAVHRTTGIRPTCLRPPYGSMDSNTVPRASAMGLQVVMWTVDPQDWRRPGAGVIAARVVNNVRPGSIVVLHDGGGERSQTVAVLDVILSALRARGYRFTPVPGC